MSDVFISHSSKDAEVGAEICEFLEQHGLNCWIAPRDVGNNVQNWGEAIISGIEQCKIMVLVLSENANLSDDVAKEVERASSKGKAIFPVRVENVEPSKSLEFFISIVQWIDVWHKAEASRYQEMLGAIKQHYSILDMDVPLALEQYQSSEVPKTRVENSLDFKETITQAIDVFMGNRKVNTKYLLLASIPYFILVIALLIFFYKENLDPDPNNPEQFVDILLERYNVFVFFSILIVGLASIVVFVQTGIIANALAAIRNKPPSVSRAMQTLKQKGLQAFIATIIFVAVTLTGNSLWILPGLYVGVVWAIYLPLIIDGKSSGLKSLGLSYRLVKGQILKVAALVLGPYFVYLAVVDYLFPLLGLGDFLDVILDGTSFMVYSAFQGCLVAAIYQRLSNGLR